MTESPTIAGTLGKQLFAKHFKPYKSNGEERDSKEIQLQFLNMSADALLRFSVAELRNGPALRKLVKIAADALDVKNFARFIRKLAIAMKRGASKPVYDRADLVILTFWDAIDETPDQLRAAKVPQLRALKPCPPLSRWAGPAACEFVNLAIPRGLRVSYTTYRQRVRRLKLKSLRPSLVTKIKTRRGLTES